MIKCKFDINSTEDSNSTSSSLNSLQQGIHQSVFMSAMVPNPSKDLPLCWDQHAKLLPMVDKVKPQEVTTWSVSEVINFVTSLTGSKGHTLRFFEQVRT